MTCSSHLVDELRAARAERIANHDRNHAEQIATVLRGWGGASTLDP